MPDDSISLVVRNYVINYHEPLTRNPVKVLEIKAMGKDKVNVMVLPLFLLYFKSTEEKERAELNLDA